MNSPLWLLGISNATPRISVEVGIVTVGVVGPALSLPALTGESATLAALGAQTGNSADRAASPPLTGVIYG